MKTDNAAFRIPADLSRVARVAAASRGQSLHAYILAALRAAVLRQAHDGDAAVRGAMDGGER